MRYHLLDHWRGLAALAVLLFHTFSSWRLDQAANPGLALLAAVVSQGYRGVNLFFVISGYCMAQLSWIELRDRRDPAAFLRDRLLRILPPYWCACLAMLALAAIALPFNHARLDTSGGAMGWIAAGARHALLLDAFVGRPGFLLVAWSLSWELNYYLVTALLLRLAFRSLSAALGLGGLLAAIGIVPGLAARFPPLAGWPAFAIGAALYAAIRSKDQNQATWPWLTFTAALGAAAVGIGDWDNYSILGAAFAFALFVLHPYDNRLAGWRPVDWLSRVGAVSYSLYLIHAPVVTLVRNLLSRIFPDTSSLYLIPMTASLLAALAATWIFSSVVEKPIERWRKSLRSTADLTANPP
jgi:exopolysaccharide production protein ExoZ